jgi:hypothetical protein
MQTKSLVVQIRPQMFLVTSQPQKFLVISTISHQLHHIFPHLACPQCFQSTIQPVAQNLSLICKLFSYVEMVHLEFFNWIYDTSCSNWIQHISWNSNLSKPTNTQFVRRQKRERERERERDRQTDRSLTDQHIGTLFFLRRYKEKYFFVDTTFWLQVFVAQLPSNAEISVWKTVWFTTAVSWAKCIIQKSTQQL